MPKTGTFFDIDPDSWKECVSVPDSAPEPVYDLCPGEVEDRSTGRTKPEPPAATLAVASSQVAQVSAALDGVDYWSFWDAHLKLVDAWAHYQAAKKMEINYSYTETEYKVAHVVGEYWGGCPELHKAVEKRSSLVDGAVERCDAVCKIYGVEPVSREWLYEHLECARDYASYRGKIKRRMSRNKPAQSLKVL